MQIYVARITFHDARSSLQFSVNGCMIPRTPNGLRFQVDPKAESKTGRLMKGCGARRVKEEEVEEEE